MNRFSKILVYVLVAQAIGVCSLVIHAAFSKEPPKKKIVVRTVKKPQPVKPALKPPEKKVGIPKKATVKPTPKKEIKPVPKKEVKKQPPEKKQEKVVPAPKKEILIPKETVNEEPKEVVDYGQVLVHFFLNSLDLPDYGEVNMDLEIDKTGRVVEIIVNESQSEANELFLKKRLPELVCPCNNQASFGGESYVCTIVFKNR